jgi:hypothetical protein
MTPVRGQQIAWHSLLFKGSFQSGDPKIAMYYDFIYHVTWSGSSFLYQLMILEAKPNT